MNKLSRLLINTIGSSQFIGSSLRIKLLRSQGFTIGENCRILPKGFFDGSNVTIGNNSFINRFVQFHDSGQQEKLQIGNNVMIGMNVILCAVSHDIGPETRRGGLTITKPIIINDGVWIGGNSMILPGVEIAEGCVIGAGSTVTKSTEPNGLYAGVPAKRIKDLDWTTFSSLFRKMNVILRCPLESIYGQCMVC